MAVKLKSLAADTTKEADGDWIDIVELPGVSFKVRSFQLPPAYRVARDLLLQRLARKNKGKPGNQDESEAEFGKLYAQHILLDWKGFDEPYTRERARDYLTDPAFRDLRRHVEYAASQVGASEVEFLEDSLGVEARLRWEIEWSRHGDMLDRLPDHWERPPEPEFPAWAGWLWRAWHDLDGERPMIAAGMGATVPGRIPWTALDRWARRYGIAGFDFEFLTRAVAVMDAVLIEQASKGNHGR